MTLTWQFEAGRTSFFMNGIVAWLSLASARTVEERSLVRPPSSDGRTSSRSWWKNGRLASIIGAVVLAAGTRSRANARSGGNALLSALSAGIATDSVRGSSAIVADSATFSRANAFAVVLKSVIRFLRFSGCVENAPLT